MNKVEKPFEDWRKFFRRNGEYSIRAIFYECDEYIEIEELYQLFKQRFIEETQDEDKND